MNQNKGQLIKIFLALVIALSVTVAATSSLFFPASPRLNPLFLARLSDLFRRNQPKVDPYDELKNLPLTAMKQVSTGIYAKEEPNLNTIFVRVTSDARFQIVQLNVNGKNLRVLVPKQ